MFLEHKISILTLSFKVASASIFDNFHKMFMNILLYEYLISEHAIYQKKKRSLE